MASGDTDGEAIRIEGQVFDGNGVVVSDALIELGKLMPRDVMRIPPIHGPRTRRSVDLAVVER